ncbi:MAG: nucleotidyltransferase domain-containing protein [Nitrospinae bacterium]|nr:nucleotidyltransferase domain-containing protein [Nitrospinota bacterium]
MGIDQNIIDVITKRILSVTKPRRIILFGSAATGAMTKDSDIDLLVLEDHPQNARKEMVRIGGALRGLEFPVDVMVMSTVRFEESKGVVGGLAYPAHKYGTVIYEAA